ncbi:hypothetical protein [Pantoea phage Nufs112]|nr:hypothetical protein [Pantoea phage Nufs112]
MEQVKVGDLAISHSENVTISTASFVDSESRNVVLAVGMFKRDGEIHEIKVGRQYEDPETVQGSVDVARAMKREALRELVTYLEMEGIL